MLVPAPILLSQDTVPVRRLILQTLPVLLEPSEAVGEQTYGVVTLSVASIRTQGRYPAEMATQALLGTPVRIIERHDGWLRIQTPDNYTGYTKSGNVTEMDAATFTAWTDAPKIIFLAHHGFAYSRADRKSPPVSDLVAGNMLRLEGKKGAFYRVSYPDGRTAFVLKAEALPIDEWLKRIDLTAESILASSQSFMGVPYLWGGTSSKAMDYSGLVKTVFFLHGLILQRDASQQCVTGDRQFQFYDSTIKSQCSKLRQLFRFGQVFISNALIACNAHFSASASLLSVLP